MEVKTLREDGEHFSQVHLKNNDRLDQDGSQSGARTSLGTKIRYNSRAVQELFRNGSRDPMRSVGDLL